MQIEYSALTRLSDRVKLLCEHRRRFKVDHYRIVDCEHVI